MLMVWLIHRTRCGTRLSTMSTRAGHCRCMSHNDQSNPTQSRAVNVSVACATVIPLIVTNTPVPACPGCSGPVVPHSREPRLPRQRPSASGQIHRPRGDALDHAGLLLRAGLHAAGRGRHDDTVHRHVHPGPGSARHLQHIPRRELAAEADGPFGVDRRHADRAREDGHLADRRRWRGVLSMLSCCRLIVL